MPPERSASTDDPWEVLGANLLELDLEDCGGFSGGNYVHGYCRLSGGGTVTEVPPS